jgi:hypothetical protein
MPAATTIIGTGCPAEDRVSAWFVEVDEEQNACLSPAFRPREGSYVTHNGTQRRHGPREALTGYGPTVREKGGMPREDWPGKRQGQACEPHVAQVSVDCSKGECVSWWAICAGLALDFHT